MKTEQNYSVTVEMKDGLYTVEDCMNEEATRRWRTRDPREMQSILEAVEKDNEEALSEWEHRRVF